MTTSELVKALAGRLHITQREARSLLDSYVGAIERLLQSGSSVTLRNFGAFSIKQVPERSAYLPARRARCLLPSHRKLEFKAAKRLREAVNQEQDDGAG